MHLATEADKSERFTIGVFTPSTPSKVFVLAIRSHAQTAFARSLVQILKKAADQCPDNRPSAVWLHFVGVAEIDFRALCDFSLNGNGAGLNAVVAEVLHPEASTSDRSHVQHILFSAQSRALSRVPMLDAKSCSDSNSGARHDLLRCAQPKMQICPSGRNLTAMKPSS